jgi:hypothetical protein
MALPVIGIAAGLTVSFVYQEWKNRPIPFIDVYDGFETPNLGDLWETDKFEPGAVTMQSEIVRAGHTAAKIVLRSHDKFEPGVDGDRDSERAELTEASRLISLEGRTYEFSFSMFLPLDFVVVPTRLVLAQWKQDCHGHSPCANASPVVAIRYSSGTLQITHQTAEHRTSLYETREDVRGRWNDFRFRIRFTPRDDGLLQAWHNGRAVVDYHGVNAYPENAGTGYASPSRFYFKIGLYRDVMDEPMTIYIDNYRKKELR